MPVPDFETWKARWDTPERRRLGVRPDRIEDGFAVFEVDLRYDDERADDPLFASAAITHAADLAALSAVGGHLDDRIQQTNGTASMHLNYVRPPAGLVMIESSLVSWDTYEAVVDIAARDQDGTLVLRGMSTYSLRPREPRGEA